MQLAQFLLVLPAVTTFAMPVITVTKFKDIIMRVIDEPLQATRSAPLVPTPSFASTLEPGTCTGFTCAGDEKALATPAPYKRDDDEPMQATHSAPLVPTPSFASTLEPGTCTGFTCGRDKIAGATPAPLKLVLRAG